MRVLKAGGQATFYAKQLDTGTSGLRKIVAEFDQVPDLGTVVGPESFSMNGKGEVVFTAALLGSNIYPRAGILANLPDSGLRKVLLNRRRCAGRGHHYLIRRASAQQSDPGGIPGRHYL